MGAASVAVLSVLAGGLIGASTASAAELLPSERTATFTPGSAVKTWTVPENVFGAIEVTISGAAGDGRMGGGAGAEFGFATERPGGEEWTFLFGGQHDRAFATLAGGAGGGLPDLLNLQWDPARAHGGNGGDATAIIAGADASCTGDAEVLAVAAGGGGGSGESRSSTVVNVVTGGRYHGGEAGKPGLGWERGRLATAAQLCSAPAEQSQGARSQGYEIERHAGGGGGGGGFVAGTGGGPDYIEPKAVLWGDFTSAGGGGGGANFLSSSICGDCATRTAAPHTSEAQIQLRWREKEAPVIGVNGNNPMVVTVHGSRTGLPMAGEVSLISGDGVVAVVPTAGTGTWRLDAMAHLDVLRGKINRVQFASADVRGAPGHLDLVIDESRATSTMTTTVQREESGDSYLVEVRLDVLAGDSKVPHLGENIDFYAAPPNTEEDFVATLPTTTTPATMPASASCLVVRVDAPHDTELRTWFGGNAFLEGFETWVRLSADSPTRPLEHDCGEPIELFVDGPGDLPEPPPSQGEMPDIDATGWRYEERGWTTLPNEWEPGARHFLLIKHDDFEGDETVGYVIDYYFDRTWAGFSHYDQTHQGWGIVLPPLTSGQHELQVLVSDPEGSYFGVSRSNRFVTPLSLTVPADQTTVTVDVADADAADAEAAPAARTASAITGTDAAPAARTALAVTEVDVDDELVLGRPVHLVASVQGVGMPEVTRGLVAFYDDDLLLGHAEVVDGVATLEDVVLDGVANEVRAEFLGVDGLSLTSESEPVTVAYEPEPVALEVEMPESAVADSDGDLRLTARVDPGNPLGLPQGELVLRSDEDEELFAFSASDATAAADGSSLSWTLPIADFPAGDHTLSAFFDAHPGFSDAASAVWQSRIEPRGTAVAVEASDAEADTTRLRISAEIAQEGIAAEFAKAAPTGIAWVYAGDRLVETVPVLRGSGEAEVPRAGLLRVEFDPAHDDLAAASTTLVSGALAATGAAASSWLWGAASVGALLLLGGAFLLVRRRFRTSGTRGSV